MNHLRWTALYLECLSMLHDHQLDRPTRLLWKVKPLYDMEKCICRSNLHFGDAKFYKTRRRIYAPSLKTSSPTRVETCDNIQEKFCRKWLWIHASLLVIPNLIEVDIPNYLRLKPSRPSTHLMLLIWSLMRFCHSKALKSNTSVHWNQLTFECILLLVYWSHHMTASSTKSFHHVVYVT